MKIAIIGGAGVRTPLLAHALAESDLPIDEIALYDADQERLAVIAPLAKRLAGRIALQTFSTSIGCIDGADFVFTSIRVGGIEVRARDETIILGHGIVGQETIGPGGFAMAMRTISHMAGYVREIAQRSPRAWIINFSNPVGIITQAVQALAGRRMIGICDTPTELFHEIAQVLDLQADRCSFDYFGLNHLGWVREVYHDGAPQLDRLWADRQRLCGLYRQGLFDPDFLSELRLLPTEYLYYYYRPEAALENTRRAGTTRGSLIARLNNKLFSDLSRPGADIVRVYEEYLYARNSSYMQIESGVAAAAAASHRGSVTGYDKIALSVVRAIHFNTGAVIPLNVPNRDNITCLDKEDVVEVPCTVNANGAFPLSVGQVPGQVRPLIVRVKEYERLTIEAALTGSRPLARKALASNPLVQDAEVAESLLTDLGLT